MARQAPCTARDGESLRPAQEGQGQLREWVVGTGGGSGLGEAGTSSFWIQAALALGRHMVWPCEQICVFQCPSLTYSAPVSSSNSLLHFTIATNWFSNNWVLHPCFPSSSSLLITLAHHKPSPVIPDFLCVTNLFAFISAKLFPSPESGGLVGHPPSHPRLLPQLGLESRLSLTLPA